ncbi:SDR family NAD(P)-dependent oxidoreductase [Actinoplanes sp. TBRC 11911]|uniref:SDR family NAD(P)-dependent oxidoreductase n=1 Tax=Actinoplanes sp. TBRC 11911 TaxID=2729386 RepID=UPI00145E44BF|nr:SDR family NAD(P)-dependent oxidoreductase [Actinoplanes sp. TBRC 11911]NMO50030.1 SDR family NAD(P)-dependent oxidoreductase [Actinoplanes sp. TBRC 11911]
MLIDGSVALVTGANSDIGREFTNGLIAAGARKVYAAARRPEEISDARLTPVQLDVTDPATVAAAAETAQDANLLVNVAGGGSLLDVLDGSIDDARAQMEVDLFGTWQMCQAFAPVLARNHGGAVVNILSVTSWAAVPEMAGYSAAKAAEWSLTNALRVALEEQGTAVLGVHSFWIDTTSAAIVKAPKSTTKHMVSSVLRALREGRSEVFLDEITSSTRRALDGDIAKVRIADVFGLGDEVEWTYPRKRGSRLEMERQPDSAA